MTSQVNGAHPLTRVFSEFLALNWGDFRLWEESGRPSKECQHDTIHGFVHRILARRRASYCTKDQLSSDLRRAWPFLVGRCSPGMRPRLRPRWYGHRMSVRGSKADRIEGRRRAAIILRGLFGENSEDPLDDGG